MAAHTRQLQRMPWLLAALISLQGWCAYAATFTCTPTLVDVNYILKKGNCTCADSSGCDTIVLAYVLTPLIVRADAHVRIPLTHAPPERLPRDRMPVSYAIKHIIRAGTMPRQ